MMINKISIQNFCQNNQCVNQNKSSKNRQQLLTNVGIMIGAPLVWAAIELESGDFKDCKKFIKKINPKTYTLSVLALGTILGANYCADKFMSTNKKENNKINKSLFSGIGASIGAVPLLYILKNISNDTKIKLSKFSPMTFLGVGLLAAGAKYWFLSAKEPQNIQAKKKSSIISGGAVGLGLMAILNGIKNPAKTLSNRIKFGLPIIMSVLTGIINYLTPTKNIQELYSKNKVKNYYANSKN